MHALAAAVAAALVLAVPPPADRSTALAVAPPADRSTARRPHVARYRAPVDAPVRDPFRPPACTWCPGNRGIEYDTVPAQPVVAAAAGTVTFAGRVAGALWVVVTHPDGLRTSYGLLDTVAVRAGQVVRAGERIAAAGDDLHFGVRRGDAYLDPATLLGGAVLVPRLVPLDGGAPRWPRSG